MQFVADLHIHSHYSRATSKDLTFEYLSKWAQLKGVHVVGTGDIAHPGWLQEMKDKLEPAEEGLFRLKQEYAQAVQREVPAACQAPVRFMLAGEISSIYKKNDKTRKIHNIIFAPSLTVVERIQAALEKIGNIRADGRPILGLDSRDLLEIILDIDPQNHLIPAHIWTPWFAMLGSMSGFDSVAECFEDLTPHIFALETGLSSDPPMNWRVSLLDGYTLVSNSDAHSPQKLAREATLFDTELSYPALFEALQTGLGFGGTLEFFPEEGKYHLDGHRKCEVRWEPETTLSHHGLCPVCGKPVTVGVMHRVVALADRPAGVKPARTHPFHSLIPLPEILGEVYGSGAASKKVLQAYDTLLTNLGSELTILLHLPLEEIEKVGGALLAEGIRRMRSGQVQIAGGYDGEYGVIKLFEAHERATFTPQISLFAPAEKREQPSSILRAAESGKTYEVRSTETSSVSQAEWQQADLFSVVRETPALSPVQAPPESQIGSPPSPDGGQNQEISHSDAAYLKEIPSQPESPLLAGLNPLQQEAARTIEAPLIIVAGPGTGKTRTLTHRIAYLIREKGVPPGQILAITFTNKAAEEMTQRLTILLGPEVTAQLVIKTFHAFGVMILRESGALLGLNPNFAICSDEERHKLLKQCCPDLKESGRQAALAQISAAKNQLVSPSDPKGFEKPLGSIYQAYESSLRQNQLLDFDDLVAQPVYLFENYPEILQSYRQRFRWISVDEYQDINLAQYRLLRLLTGPQTNLCVIGDPDQAIYGFRGADRTYFLSFARDFSGAKTLHLSQNYRSSQLILDASTQVIAKSPTSYLRQLQSDILDPTRLEVYHAPNEAAEAEYLVHQIEQMIGGLSYFSLDSGRVAGATGMISRSFADFAVFYRLGVQGQPLIEAFERSGIPYQTVGQTPFYERKEIKQILAYLWFSYNPHSLIHLETILNAEKETFKAKTLAQLTSLAETHKLSLWEMVQQFEQFPIFNMSQKKQLQTLAPFLRELKKIEATTPLPNLVELIVQFISQFQSDFTEKHSEQIKGLRLKTVPFENRLADFLETAMLHKETDDYDPRADRVTLMTLHASKGLEFPVVFMVGCEDGLLPYQHGQEPPNLEEERRLFYVGMTRVQQKLILTHAKTRLLFGQKYQNKPSPFLNDIENTLKEIKAMTTPKAALKKETMQLKLF